VPVILVSQQTAQTLAISLEAGYNNSMDLQRTRKCTGWLLWVFLSFLGFALFHNLWKTRKIKKLTF